MGKYWKKAFAPSSVYDYSKSVINGKFADDWNYIVCWSGLIFRFGELISRDVSADPNTTIQVGVSYLTAQAIEQILCWFLGRKKLNKVTQVKMMVLEMNIRIYQITI